MSDSLPSICRQAMRSRGIVIRSMSPAHSRSGTLHYIAAAGDERYFLSVYRNRSEYGRAACEVARAESFMNWREARAVRSHIEWGGLPWTSIGGWVIIAREYVPGRPWDVNDRRELMRVVKAFCRHVRMMRQNIIYNGREFLAGVRFAPFGFCIEAVGRRYDDLGDWMTEEERAVFDRALARAKNLSRASQASDYVLCHGDATRENIIMTESGPQVIDHQCMHYDLAWVDHASLFVSLSTPSYFAGKIDARRANVVLRGLKEWLDDYEETVFGDVVRYVLLKKIALVRRRKNLLLQERLALLASIDSYFPPTDRNFLFLHGLPGKRG